MLVTGLNRNINERNCGGCRRRLMVVGSMSNKNSIHKTICSDTNRSSSSWCTIDNDDDDDDDDEYFNHHNNKEATKRLIHSTTSNTSQIKYSEWKK